jgi:hypothetical protein
MSNGSTERAALGSLDIDMDPLAILGHFGKAINPRLIDGEPFGLAKLRALSAIQILRAVEYRGHAQALWLDTEMTSPVM